MTKHGVGVRLADTKECVCPECGKEFLNDDGMQTHRHMVHGSAPMTVGDKIRCAKCGVLVRNTKMARHLEQIHAR